MKFNDERIEFNYLDEIVYCIINGETGKKIIITCDHELFRKYFDSTTITADPFPYCYFTLTGEIPYPDKKFFNEMLFAFIEKHRRFFEKSNRRAMN